jgi:hypothetical protein
MISPYVHDEELSLRKLGKASRASNIGGERFLAEDGDPAGKQFFYDIAMGARRGRYDGTIYRRQARQRRVDRTG